MKSLLQQDVRQELSARLNNLSQNHQPLWGKMDGKKMLSHLVDSLKMSFGDLPVEPKSSVMSFAPIRYLIIYWLPFPKNVPTAKELIARSPEKLDAEKQQLSALIDKYSQYENKEAWPAHPIFGKMTKTDWGVLGYRHIDHHFRQFKI